MLAVKLALALLLLKSELILPSSRLPEWLQVLEVWCFRSLNNLLLLLMYYPDFGRDSAVSFQCLHCFRRDSRSGGSFGPSLVAKFARGFWQCCQGLDTAGSVFLYEESEWGRENLPLSICNGLELFEHIPSLPPFQTLRCQQCCHGCTLGVLWHRGNHHHLCEMHAIMFAAPVGLDGTPCLDNSGQALW